MLMIRGRITPNSQALIVLDLKAASGRFQPVEVVLDTGFGGDLLLPPETIGGLGLTPDTEVDATLANGQEIRLDSWHGTVRWHGNLRNIQVLEAEGEPLLGMHLIRGSRDTMEVKVEGEVIIEELS